MYAFKVTLINHEGHFPAALRILSWRLVPVLVKNYRSVLEFSALSLICSEAPSSTQTTTHIKNKAPWPVQPGGQWITTGWWDGDTSADKMGFFLLFCWCTFVNVNKTDDYRRVCEIENCPSGVMRWQQTDRQTNLELTSIHPSEVKQL